MDLKILIVTSDRNFGEQLSQALQDAGHYPLFTAGIAEAAFVARDEKCPIAILDCNMPEPGTAYLADELRARIKNLRIIFIHPNECGDKTIKLDPPRDIDLPQPSFLPDLLEVINLWAVEKKASIDEVKTPP